jgi:UDPglucose 6-dehydrogenase
MRLICFYFLLSFTFINIQATRFRNNYSTSSHMITVIGTGYVGLITGACLADMGHTVICVDSDKKKIDLLNSGIVPIYEPGLDQLININVNAQRLSFTYQIDNAIDQSDVIFIAVGTPMGIDGCADLTALNAVFEQIIPHLSSYKLICIKSTVPIGTGNLLVTKLQENGVNHENYDIVSNPEFLREGSAIHDFMAPDRIIIGAYSENARVCMKELYAPLINLQVPCFFTTLSSAEMIKYGSNSFLATKLSFINEIANLCDCTGADIVDVAYGMGLDKRIGAAFLKPGPGFGGSCFPKDCLALCMVANKMGRPLQLIETALVINEQKLEQLLNYQLAGKTIALLGLAFKNNTDDIRYSPAITTIELLLEKGASIKAYDPAAIQNMKALFPNIIYESSMYNALQNADAAIILTEWEEFKSLDLIHAKKLMKTPILVDVRNLLDPALLKKYNFSFSLLGRS